MKIKFIEKSAIFNDARTHRFTLFRNWNSEKSYYRCGENYCAFIGLNPSTADEDKSDPTVTRCIQAAYNWGFDGMYMLNLFPLRATNPKDMMSYQGDHLLQDNDDYICRVVDSCYFTVACWGNHGQYLGRSEHVRRTLRLDELLCLGVNDKTGEPKHPLYLRNGIKPVHLGEARLAWAIKTYGEDWVKNYFE